MTSSNVLPNRRIRRKIQKDMKKLEREELKRKEHRNVTSRSENVIRRTLKRIRKLDTSSSEDETSIQTDDSPNSVSYYFSFHFIFGHFWYNIQSFIYTCFRLHHHQANSYKITVNEHSSVPKKIQI